MLSYLKKIIIYIYIVSDIEEKLKHHLKLNVNNCKRLICTVLKYPIIKSDYKLNIRNGKWKQFHSKCSNQIYLIRYSFLFIKLIFILTPFDMLQNCKSQHSRVPVYMLLSWEGWIYPVATN